MIKPTIRIHNLETDEIIDREMNDDEFEIYQTNQNLTIEKEAEKQATLEAKTALLERLGITEAEAKLLSS